jgi:hypothetical protein
MDKFKPLYDQDDQSSTDSAESGEKSTVNAISDQHGISSKDSSQSESFNGKNPIMDLIPEEDDSTDTYLSKIIIRNSDVLTLDGTKSMCQKFGNVQFVNRSYAGFTFVQFSKPEEAKCAVESLNNMFEFDFRAEICRKKDQWEPEKIGPLPKFETQLKYAGPYLPPITIKYPHHERSISLKDYENPRLEIVDPDKLFYVTDYLHSKRGGYSM